MALFGGVAEWLGGGLQNLKRRFESVLTPQNKKAIIQLCLNVYKCN
jgi:hypothetical protein